MTREEFRDYVDVLRSQNEISYNVYSELIDGIDTLEQEPCDYYDTYNETCRRSEVPKEPCEDYISRKAVINITAETGALITQLRVRELPSVTPQPKIGHWISHSEHCKMNNLRPSGLGCYWWCSECDYGVECEYFYTVNFKHCPNCGAEMESEE